MLYRVLNPDGEVVELEEPAGSRIVPVGDVGVPSPLIYRHLGEDDQPQAELTFEVWKGVPVCTEVRITAKPETGTHVRSKNIKGVAAQLEDYIEQWMSFLACQPLPAPPGRRQWQRVLPQTNSDQRPAMLAVRSARREVRRKMTDELLQQVADTYLAATKARTEAVARAFAVSYRTAQRYIEKAREAGVLERTDQ